MKQAQPKILRAALAALTLCSASGWAPTATAADRAPRIVGGTPSAEGAWPWQAALEFRDAYSGLFSQRCGGSVIDARWVISAAHCFTPEAFQPGYDPAREIRVRVGSRLQNQGGQVVGVARLILHPAFDDVRIDNDLALLELAQPVKVQPVGLLAPEDENRLAAPGTRATVTGWGATAWQGTSSPVLLQVEVPIVSRATCAAQYTSHGEYPADVITENMLCAGDLQQGGKDACRGDSGGPLVVPDGRNGYLQVGVVSWGNSCGDPAYPGVYTRLPRYRDWISSQTGLQLGVQDPLARRLDCLFDWAEYHFPEWFAPAGGVTQTAAVSGYGHFSFRYYSKQEAYLAHLSEDDGLYYFGPESAFTILRLGDFDAFATFAGCTR